MKPFLLLSIRADDDAADEEVFEAIDAAVASGATELAIGGIRRSYRVEGKRHTEIFVPLAYSLAIRREGGTK